MGDLRALLSYCYDSCNICAAGTKKQSKHKNQIDTSSLQRTMYIRFQKEKKLITSKSSNQAKLKALVDRLTRKAREIAQMDAKIVMSLETEEDIL